MADPSRDEQMELLRDLVSIAGSILVRLEHLGATSPDLLQKKNQLRQLPQTEL